MVFTFFNKKLTVFLKGSKIKLVLLSLGSPLDSKQIMKVLWKQDRHLITRAAPFRYNIQ